MVYLSRILNFELNAKDDDQVLKIGRFPDGRVQSLFLNPNHHHSRIYGINYSVQECSANIANPHWVPFDSKDPEISCGGILF